MHKDTVSKESTGFEPTAFNFARPTSALDGDKSKTLKDCFQEVVPSSP
jgi:hypothetical protein